MLRNLVITPVLNGYTVAVGCQTLVYQSLKDLLVDLHGYYTAGDPDKFEEEFFKNQRNYDKIPGAFVSQETRIVGTAIRARQGEALAMERSEGVSDLEPLVQRVNEFARGSIEGDMPVGEVGHMRGARIVHTSGPNYKTMLAGESINPDDYPRTYVEQIEATMNTVEQIRHVVNEMSSMLEPYFPKAIDENPSPGLEEG